jgi:biopolymer transport protein ExbD
MKLKRKRDTETRVYTDSLSDIMFFLLLFFLIISTLVNPSVIQLMLPKASANIQKMNKQTINISVTKELQYFLNDKPILLENIKPEIEKMSVISQEATVIIRADQSITVQQLVNLLDI